ncbi:glycosyltransferase family 4 protein [Colwellia sp. TT2012]|uniref:glycosyltransferase family 4 protein n=1 Tax=Colwellia sp. TT2012 TaxID=1720342 RepID=UPI00070E90DB|nr:glycosyltransferase family 4 protein [Colwellia sp. TT2012]
MINSNYVLITSNMYRPSVGGIENSLYHLAKEYKALGYKVLIVTSDITHLNVELPEYEMEDGIEIYRYRTFSGQGVLGFSKHLTNAFFLYKRLLKTYQPSTVICRYHFNLMLLKLAGCKNITYLIPGVVKNETKISMNLTLSGFAKIRAKLSFAFHQYLQEKALEHANKLFVFSQNMLTQVSEITDRKDITITKPGVSLNRFFPLCRKDKLLIREELGLTTDKIVLICIGRLVKAKGFETAIRAIVASHKDNLELWILGDGHLFDDFKKLTAELQCQTQVKLLGRQQCPERYYQAADVFVMSSIYEPLGQTILEALATGLPIITAPSSSTVVTASNEIIDKEHNFFTAEHSIEAFSHAFCQVAELLDNDYRTISEFNRQQAKIKFNWSVLAQELLDDEFILSKKKDNR